MSLLVDLVSSSDGYDIGVGLTVEAGALHEVGEKEKEQDSVGAATPT